MSRAESWSRSAIVFAALFFLCSPAFAQHVAGLRLTQTDFDHQQCILYLDITEYYDTTFGTGGGGPFSTAYLGVATGFGYQIAPAIDWGDGATLSWQGGGSGIPLASSSVSIAGAPRQVYRGSFTHTYPAPGTYMVLGRSSNAGSVGGPGTVGSPGYDVFTGNYAVLVTPTFSSTFRYLTNSLPEVVDLEIGIPVTSDSGLIALALLLVGSALLLLRRS